MIMEMTSDILPELLQTLVHKFSRRALVEFLLLRLYAFSLEMVFMVLDKYLKIFANESPYLDRNFVDLGLDSITYPLRRIR